MKLFNLNKIRENLSFARFDRQELSGSLGDLGTFLPIILGLSAVVGLSFPAMLFWAGASNLVTGLTFAIPMPVQPMKAIAAVALSEGLTAGEVYAAGLLMSLFMILIWQFNLTKYLERYIPIVIIRGIQFTIGLKLLLKGIEIISKQPVTGHDSIIVGVVGAIFVLVFINSSRIPTALILFVVGILIVVINDSSLLSSAKASFFFPSIVEINLSDFKAGFKDGAMAQLPLTLLNSVIAVSALSFDLFPKRGADVSKITLSVGLMNLSCLFGAMPMCHGSGGLAAQSRFGAKTNGSILFLGTTKLLAALVLGSSLLPIISAFPESLLGVLLLIAGMELCLTIRSVRKIFDLTIIFAISITTIITSSLTIGFTVSIILYLVGRTKYFNK